MKAQQDALAELKQDDKVASEYRGRYEVHTISKVTPTGQIVLEDGSRWKNGRKMGESGGWYSSYLYPLTPAIAEKVRRQNAREYIDYVLNRRILDVLSTEDLEAIVAVLKKHKESEQAG